MHHQAHGRVLTYLFGSDMAGLVSDLPAGGDD